jgi:sugar/nucleoside kinase (ribokinase family)
LGGVARAYHWPPVRRKRPRLACLGDLVLDIVVRAQAGVALGTDVPGTVRLRVGGSAANTARAFARLGGAASFIGAVGNDRLGTRMVASLRADGVTVHAIKRRGNTARLLALIDADGERSFVTERGAADSLRPSALKGSWLSGRDALHLPAYSLLKEPLSEAALTAAARVHQYGGLVSVDLASHKPLLARGKAAAWEMIGAVSPDVLFANRDETAALVGARDARRLLQLAPLVVLKQGADGCRGVWSSAARAGFDAIDVPTKPVDGADTTGAGDAFDAGFLYALLRAGASGADGLDAGLARAAAVAGHRAARRLLTSARTDLEF